MSSAIPKVVPPLPVPNDKARNLPWRTAFEWLGAGWEDLKTNPLPSLIYGLIVFAVSLVVVWSLFRFQLDYILFPALLFRSMSRVRLDALDLDILVAFFSGGLLLFAAMMLFGRTVLRMGTADQAVLALSTCFSNGVGLGSCRPSISARARASRSPLPSSCPDASRARIQPARCRCR